MSGRIGMLLCPLAILLLCPLTLPVVSAVDRSGDEVDAPKERLLLDDMEDVAEWYNGSPEETTISASDRHARVGTRSLHFANVVDHTTGEKNYPVGWPRTGKDLAKTGPTDWSSYDFFECWIFVETSRDKLPPRPLGVGFYHSGQRRSTHVRLNEVQADRWTKIVVPIADLESPSDVQRVQFNITESEYKHQDRVDFYIDDMVLSRYVYPIVSDVRLDRQILYSTSSRLSATYELAGYRGQDGVEMELEMALGTECLGSVRQPVNAMREIALPLKDTLTTGNYVAMLRVHCAKADGVHERTVPFRVIEGPFPGGEK